MLQIFQRNIYTAELNEVIQETEGSALLQENLVVEPDMSAASSNSQSPLSQKVIAKVSNVVFIPIYANTY
jgi:hypothetical protein